jgi:hypothetical protein
MKLHLFVGPSAAGMEPELLERPEVVVHAPARRGDIQALVEHNAQPGCIAIVDGTFHSFPSVGHIEIRHAIEQGWKIWGLASMGVTATTRSSMTTRSRWCMRSTRRIAPCLSHSSICVDLLPRYRTSRRFVRITLKRLSATSRNAGTPSEPYRA